MPLTDPLPREITTRNRVLDRQREKAWQKDQRARIMASQTNADTLAKAAREPSKTHFRAMGLVVDWKRSARARKLRAANLLSPDAQKLYARTEKVVKVYATDSLQAFEARLDEDFLTEETERILEHEGHGLRVWNDSNNAYLVKPKLEGKPDKELRPKRKTKTTDKEPTTVDEGKLKWEANAPQIKFGVRAWIASRVYENIQEREELSRRETGQPAQQGQFFPASQIVPASQLVPARQIALASIDETLQHALNVDHLAEQARNDNANGTSLDSDDASDSMPISTTRNTRKRKHPARRTQSRRSDPRDQSERSHQRRRRDVSMSMSTSNMTSESDSPRMADVTQPPILLSSNASTSLSYESNDGHGSSGTLATDYSEGQPSTRPTNEPDPYCVFPNKDCQRKKREKLGLKLRQGLGQASEYQKELRKIISLIDELYNVCEFHEPTHGPRGRWEAIYFAMIAWKDTLKRFNEFEKATQYWGQSRQGWAGHLKPLTLAGRTHCQEELGHLQYWGKTTRMSRTDFQNRFHTDLSVMIEALLGNDYSPFEFEGLIAHLDVFNKDLLDWFRVGRVVVVPPVEAYKTHRAESSAEHGDLREQDYISKTTHIERAPDSRRPLAQKLRTSRSSRQTYATQ